MKPEIKYTLAETVNQILNKFQTYSTNNKVLHLNGFFREDIMLNSNNEIVYKNNIITEQELDIICTDAIYHLSQEQIIQIWVLIFGSSLKFDSDNNKFVIA